MASFRKKGSGWVAEVFMQGIRKSKSFATKAEAVAWANKMEGEIYAGKRGNIPDKKVRWLLERYSDEVSPRKGGKKWEVMRLSAMAEMPIASIDLVDLGARHVTQWRDERLKTVQPATVNREWNLLSNVFTVAVNEWEVLRENPMRTVKRPPPGEARDRRISDDEIERLLFSLGYEHDKTPATASPRVGAALLFAIETAIRAGEIVKMRWQDVDLGKRIVRLPETKNGTRRNVPLSTEAIRILRQMQGVNSVSVFSISSGSMDTLFRKAKTRAMIDDLHFHDTRHEAITRLAKKLEVLELARMVGHKDLKQLMVYYNATAEELAEKLG